ncbi:hypothetical protein EMPS_09099 [Entomortierella parvispora]|uniref:Uncharacterized protein n=1 Tax=Entomortierella parvispora TaxID=205924 RepID=A0A9P3HHD7_9FUNG|nr:hypothetical protein EMPS_09099 [Entomortierella parvispora]
MDTTSSPTGTSIASTSLSSRKRKSQSINFSSSSSTPPSLPSSHTTTEESTLAHPPPLWIMTHDPSTFPVQPDSRLHFNTAPTTATATATATTTPSTTNRRQFRVSATFGGPGSNSGSGSSLLTSSTPSPASSPLSPLAETMAASPTILFSNQFPFSPPSPNPEKPSSSPPPNAVTSAAEGPGPRVSPMQRSHSPSATHPIIETETDSGAAAATEKTIQDPNASPSFPTSTLISSPLKSSTFGNFYFLPTNPSDAPSSPVRETLMAGSREGVGPLDCTMGTSIHPLDQPALLSNPLVNDTIMEEDEEPQQQQPFALTPSPRLRQQGSGTTLFNTALNRPRARYTFGYDEPLISSLPPRENSISSSSSSCSSPTSPYSVATTASPSSYGKTVDITTTTTSTPMVMSTTKKKVPPPHNVLSTLPLSSAVHSPRLQSTTCPSPSTPPASPSSARVHQPPSPDGLVPLRSLRRVSSKSTPRPQRPPTPQGVVHVSPPASPRLSGRKRFSFLSNLLGTTPPPSWSESDPEKPLPATPAGASQLYRHHSLQQQQLGRHGSWHPPSSPPQNFKNASAVDLPSYAASMTPSTATTTMTITTTATSTTQSSSPSYSHPYQDRTSLMPLPTPSKMMMLIGKNRGGSNASMKALYDHYDDRNHSHDHQDTTSIYHLHENYYNQEGSGGVGGGSGESDLSVGHGHKERGLVGERQPDEYLSASPTNPYSVSQTSLKIQILPSISQYALHNQLQHQHYHHAAGTAEEEGSGIGQPRSRSRLDLTIVLVPEDSVGVHDHKLNNLDRLKLNSPQDSSPHKGKKRCASLSIFRYFLKK